MLCQLDAKQHQLEIERVTVSFHIQLNVYFYKHISM